MGEGKREGTAKVEYCAGCGHALPQLGATRVFFSREEGSDRTHDNDECVKLRNENRFGTKAPARDYISIHKAERSALLACEEALREARQFLLGQFDHWAKLADGVNRSAEAKLKEHSAAVQKVNAALSLLDEARHGK